MNKKEATFFWGGLKAVSPGKLHYHTMTDLNGGVKAVSLDNLSLLNTFNEMPYVTIQDGDIVLISDDLMSGPTALPHDVALLPSQVLTLYADNKKGCAFAGVVDRNNYLEIMNLFTDKYQSAVVIRPGSIVPTA